jgi:hydrogenase nickel incorporation protein HypA/HybF
MHEFSLAAEIVEIVKKSALNAGKSKVTAIQLEIGELSGVEEPALITALESLTTNTIIQTSEVLVERTKGLAKCKECNTEFELTDLFTLCPECNSFYKDIISGKEFNILSIEAE